jgi:hypothetical protein
MVGSDLANIVNEAALLAARKSREAVTMQDFEEAIDRVVAGLEKRNRMMNPKEKEIVAYHETGHALVAEGLPGVDPVHRVSIIPRGIGALGYTMQLPTEDRYLMTKSELEDRMAVMLGGRVAEEVHFGEISTGAQNDLYRATDIARSMVREYGMSEKLGPLTFERERRPLFLETMMPPAAKDYSEATAQQIDREVSALAEKAYHAGQRDPGKQPRHPGKGGPGVARQGGPGGGGTQASAQRASQGSLSLEGLEGVRPKSATFNLNHGSQASALKSSSGQSLMSLTLSHSQEKSGGVGLRARQNTGWPETAIPPEYSPLKHFSQ